MILSIFQWLPKKTLMRCSLVNHRFNRVSQDESLWTRLDLAGKVLQPYALGRVVHRGLVILRLAQCKVTLINPARMKCPASRVTVNEETVVQPSASCQLY